MIKSILRKTIGRFPSIAMFYRTLRDHMDQRKPTLKTPWGFTLSGHPAMARGDFEPKETLVVRRLLEDVDIFINVGANVGYYCCHSLSMGKPVIAVEPIASNLYYLLKNIRENGWTKNAQIFPLAVGANTDILKMWGGGDRCINGKRLGLYPRKLCHSCPGAESGSHIRRKSAG